MSRLQTAMLSSGHQQKDNKGTTGARGQREQKEGKIRTKEGQKEGQSRTTGGQEKGNLRTRCSEKDKEDRRRTKGKHRVGQRGQRTKGRQDPDTKPGHRAQGRGQPVWPALFFLRENPNSKLLGELKRTVYILYLYTPPSLLGLKTCQERQFPNAQKCSQNTANTVKLSKKKVGGHHVYVCMFIYIYITNSVILCVCV